MDPGNGMIPESEVIGRAFLIVWPPSQWRILPIPLTFQQPGIVPEAKPASGPLRAGASGRHPTAAATARPVVASAFPLAPYTPAAAGVVGAVPLIWLRRRRLLRRAGGRPRGRDRSGDRPRFRVRAGGRGR